MASEQYCRFAERMRAARAQQGPGDAMPSIRQLRAQWDEIGRAHPPPPGTRTRTVDAGGVPAEWVEPVGGHDEDRTLLYFHGGGYCLGSPATHRGLVARLAEAAGARALSVDYRLAPENPFPSAVDDAVTAYDWLASLLGTTHRLVLAGDSAGGGLVLALLVALRDRRRRNEGGHDLPAAAVCMSPSTDLAKTGHSIVTNADLDWVNTPLVSSSLAAHYLGPTGDPRHPLVSSLYADLRELPPLLVLVGTWEILLDDSLRLVEKARTDGVEITLEEWDEMSHLWPFFLGDFPEAEQAVERMGAFIRRF